MGTVALPWDLRGRVEKTSEVNDNLVALQDGLNALDQTNFAAGKDNLYPWTIDIDPFTTPATQTNWSTITVDAAWPNNGYLGGGTSQQLGWDVALAAGTWNISTYCHRTGGGASILEVRLDGLTAVNLILVATPGLISGNFNVATTGKKRLLLLGSSSSTFKVSTLQLTRTV